MRRTIETEPERPRAEAGRALPFLLAAGLLLGLTVFAHGVVLVLAAIAAGPLPAAQTALFLSRKSAASQAAETPPEAASAAAPEEAADSAPQAQQGIEAYCIALQDDTAKPENAGTVLEKTYPQGSGEKFIACGAGSIKNNTRVPAAEVAAEIENPLPFAVEWNSPEPQVLIMHTHATESYQLWPDPVYDKSYAARSRNTALNVCAVGAEMARVLNEAGINTLHDTTLYDAPGYTDSYKRSRAGVQEYLARYPSIKVVLDVHRDAIEDSDGTRVKPVCEIGGESTAQVMVIAGCDNGGSIALPNWRLNLRLAAAWEAAMEEAHPGLTRSVLCGYRFYNQDLTTGSLLIEVGGHANTLDEAIRAGRYAAEGLAKAVG